MKAQKHQILIIGASGFLGAAIYKELLPYFKTYGTYCKDQTVLNKNQQFYQYNFEEDSIFEILEIVRPNIIISAVRGDFNAQFLAHKHIIEYVNENETKLIFLSSANVFDAYSKFPSYEVDKTLSNSIYGHFKIKIENAMMALNPEKYAILRLPMVFGLNSPRIQELVTLHALNEAIEVFPNLIINVTSVSNFTQQLHYIINHDKHGIFHLGSNDLVQHDEFITNIVNTLSLKNVIFKHVYTTNEDRYLAVLAKHNLLPQNLQFQSTDLLNELHKH